MLVSLCIGLSIHTSVTGVSDATRSVSVPTLSVSDVNKDAKPRPGPPRNLVLNDIQIPNTPKTTSLLSVHAGLCWRRGVVISGVCRMNEVNARRARLVPGWVTCEFP